MVASASRKQRDDSAGGNVARAPTTDTPVADRPTECCIAKHGSPKDAPLQDAELQDGPLGDAETEGEPLVHGADADGSLPEDNRCHLVSA